MKWKNLLWLAFFTLVTGAFPQSKTLDRQYVPIILNNHLPPIYNININEWTAFSYNTATRTWRGIPFQVDELKGVGKYERDESKKQPEIEQIDEIVFMPEDLGDKAPLSAWMDVADSVKANRIEVQMTDPLDSSKKGWLYLFKNVVNPPIVTSYFTYTPQSGTVSSADTLTTDSYKLAHSNYGLPNKLSFAPAYMGDLVDRLKFRFSGKVKVLGTSYNINENKISPQTDPLNEFSGLVRYFRDVQDKIKIQMMGIEEKSFDPKLQYFPYSINGQVALNDFDDAKIALAGVKLIRLSFDLSPEASGMIFFSEKNRTGFTIDGIPDNPDKTISNPNALNWFMATGPLGTVLMNLKLPAVQYANSQLYYRDNSAGGTADGTDDTGDNQSWGDMGIYITATEDGISTKTLEINYTMYFINQDFSANAAEMGDKIRDWQANPCTVAAVTQEYVPDPSRITRKTYKPASFQISQPYPNPHHVASGPLTFEFTSIKQRDDYTLAIYNVLGQEIRRYANIYALKDTKRIVLWDGRDSGGALVMPGTYFYKLFNSRDSLSGKFILVR